jgi:hypothetical protein
MSRAGAAATMRLLRARDRKPQPWKNGGGTTSEIAAFPAGASLDDFGWRVSIAEVASGGPFSTFPGIDRTLVVLDGEGITLGVAGRPPTRLDRRSEPLRFAADVPTVATLCAGPIRDLNVMTRRGRFDHSVMRLDPDSLGFRPMTTVALFVAGSIPLRLSAAGMSFDLERHDALLLEQADPGEMAHDMLAIEPLEGLHSDVILVAIEPYGAKRS